MLTAVLEMRPILPSNEERSAPRRRNIRQQNRDGQLSFGMQPNPRSMSTFCCQKTLFPSLTLLKSPLDFIVTTNHAGLWQKHVAWAKPDGAHLKQYITGHYASIMILLSLLLTASISIFFNSSQELSEMRIILGRQSATNLTHLKFWTGLLVLLDIFVTLLGLVTTFTLWCMISAISDVNAHCIIRSSLGQYAISLPPRLVVGSLYIFLLWTLLFVLELVAHPLSWMLVTTVVLFFVLAIIIPLSALGRLILHTGGMANRPILPEELEHQLLPSGLYSSLLLRATHRQRRNPYDVTRQYRSTIRNRLYNAEQEEISSSYDEEAAFLLNGEERVEQGTKQTPPDKGTKSESTTDRSKLPRWNHRRFQSVDTLATELPLPHASVLNAAISSQELFELMENAKPVASREFISGTNRIDENDETTQQNDRTPTNGTVTFGDNAQSTSDVATNNAASGDHRPPRPPRTRQHHRRASSAVLLLNEWTEDVNVRDLYGAAMPAELPPEEIAFDTTPSSPPQQRPNLLSSLLPDHGSSSSFRWWTNSSLGNLSEDDMDPEDAAPGRASVAINETDHRDTLRDPLLGSFSPNSETDSPTEAAVNDQEGQGTEVDESGSLLRGEHLLGNDRSPHMISKVLSHYSFKRTPD